MHKHTRTRTRTHSQTHKRVCIHTHTHTLAWTHTCAHNGILFALAAPGSSDGGGSGNIFENAQKALQDGAANAQEIFSQAVRDAIQNARDEGSLFTGGVTQAILQDTAESGVFGEAVGNFLGETIRNVVTQGINNIVNSWVGTISQLFRG